MTDIDTGRLAVGEFLRQPPDGPIVVADHLRGFAGLHGGLCLARMASAMQRHAADAPMVGITAQFHGAVRSAFRIDADVVRDGRTVTTVAARALSGSTTRVSAGAVFGSHRARTLPPLAPPAPAAPAPTECEVFAIPPAFVPISEQVEIRPVGRNRPFSGGAAPELTAWIRLVEDDTPPDLPRLLFLLDALAPSYAAVLSRPRPIPTIELSVRPGDGLPHATSPWVLLAARTSTASADGWIDERVDAWTPDGRHLGTAHQLRLVQP